VLEHTEIETDLDSENEDDDINRDANDKGEHPPAASVRFAQQSAERVSRLFEQLAVFHHELHAAKRFDVLRGIAFDGDQIREQAWLD
jgi:hypothetical protein